MISIDVLEAKDMKDIANLVGYKGYTAAAEWASQEVLEEGYDLKDDSFDDVIIAKLSSLRKLVNFDMNKAAECCLSIKRAMLIKKYRQRLCKTQKELEVYLGLSSSMLQKMESGKRKVNHEVFLAIERLVKNGH